jgi:general secretion pathway protein H
MISQCEPIQTKRHGQAAGFTLIEMVVVLAILGFALTLIAGHRAPWSREFGLETTAAELAGQLRLVRSAAIAGNRAVSLDLDIAGHRYRPGPAPLRTLPPHFSIQLNTIAGERRAADVAGIRFNPDGSSTGGSIVLADGPRRIAVGVDWLTGRISVGDVP